MAAAAVVDAARAVTEIPGFGLEPRGIPDASVTRRDAEGVVWS
jgi:hypothetical protein